MPESPLANASEVLKLTLSSEGTELDPAIGIASITINNAVNKIPYARIELHDGDMPEKTFPLSDGNDFDPGKEIEIKAGYGQDQDVIFSGIVVKHSIRIDNNNDARLVVECRDKAVKLTVGRNNACYLEMKDSEIISQLIDAAGLAVNAEATGLSHEKLVQYYCSDWDFILSRAELNGMLVTTANGEISVGAPDTGADSDLKLTYGEDLMEFQADIDARTQFAKVETSAWDSASQQLSTGNAAPASLNQQGDLDSKALSQVLGLEAFQLQTQAELPAEDMKGWASAQQVKSGLARIRGRTRFQGSAKAAPGTLIELEGVGNHFNGKVFVGSATHQIADGNWFTEVGFGLDPEWFAERRDLMAPPASGLLPGVDGMQIGKVVKVNGDPATAYRIQISLPLLGAGGVEAAPIWARLAGFYASSEVGAFFLPEVDDEVLVGFLNDDPTQPVVLGSLFSATNQAPYQTGDSYEDNKTKAIVTRAQLRIEFDEEKKIVTIATPGGAADTTDLSAETLNKVVLDDDQQSILLQDQNGNKVELCPDGIKLDSPKDIAITAQGKITLDATGEISVASQADVGVNGSNVSLEAQIGLTAKGSGSAELSASGNTTIKGAMVMIN